MTLAALDECVSLCSRSRLCPSSLTLPPPCFRRRPASSPLHSSVPLSSTDGDVHGTVLPYSFFHSAQLHSTVAQHSARYRSAPLLAHSRARRTYAQSSGSGTEPSASRKRASAQRDDGHRAAALRMRAAARRHQRRPVRPLSGADYRRASQRTLSGLYRDMLGGVWCGRPLCTVVDSSSRRAGAWRTSKERSSGGGADSADPTRLGRADDGIQRRGWVRRRATRGRERSMRRLPIRAQGPRARACCRAQSRA
ncbi:hypothetical protein BV20DRAFT_446420 [Pilatotrama ljubarskyi]|nr:hypothetical protein BV20DRAFT_446420 [Pilatotrama ljubarskyi]